MSYSTNDPSKVNGQYHSVKGTAVETVGNLTGLQSWQTSGKDEHASGEAEINAAQAKEYVDATGDRISGKYDAVVGAVTGDKQQQAAGNIRHDAGEAKQELNKPNV